MSIRYFHSLPRASVDSLSGKVLAQVRREFGAEVEPFTLHLPVPELLAGVWMACRETLLAGSGRRDAKEVVAASVSALNCCPFCVDAHSIMVLESSGHDYSNLANNWTTLFSAIPPHGLQPRGLPVRRSCKSRLFLLKRPPRLSEQRSSSITSTGW